MQNRESELQNRLRQNDKSALQEVYTTYRDEFVQFAKRYQLVEHDILDVYQDATIALYQNFAMKQLDLNKSSVKTYLFGIAKYKIFNLIKENKRKNEFKNEYPYETIELPIENNVLTEEQRKMTKYFGRIGESCQNILKLFYYRGLTVKEIVQLTNYKDENTVKSHKSRCLKKLRELIKNG